MVGEGDMGGGQNRIAVDTGVSNWRLVIGKIFSPFGEGGSVFLGYQTQNTHSISSNATSGFRDK